MADFTRNSDIIITCPKNISAVLASEVENLGFKVMQTHSAYIGTEGSLIDCMVLNMWLRTAHRVLYKLKEFRAVNPDDLYREVVRFPWENIIEADGYFSVISEVFNESINDTRFASLKVKDAIVDRIKDKKGIRPDSGPERDSVVIYIYWHESKATLYIDTSGETIAKHGYRIFPGKAPMQETLAAAVVLSSKWKPGDVFINPMCGSGTLAIEAALIAAQKAPGLLRENFGFMHLIGYPPAEWARIRDEARRKMVIPKGRFLLSDRSEDAVDISRKNASYAGLDKIMEFSVDDFRNVEIPEGENGIVIFNPEYGERLGEVSELEETYKEIGDFFKKKCKGYTGYIFTGNPGLGKKIGLKTKRKIPFYNGTIECRLLEYELYEGSKRANSNF